jgi:hypothetical protein
VQKKSKEDSTPDAFFWPMMPNQLVKNKLDNKSRKFFVIICNKRIYSVIIIEPDINQPYLIPAPYNGPDGLQSNMNHIGVYSMWEHFVDFLATDSLSVVPFPRKAPGLNPFYHNNHYTGHKRLSTFIHLSQGKHVQDGISSQIPIFPSSL